MGPHRLGRVVPQGIWHAECRGDLSSQYCLYSYEIISHSILWSSVTRCMHIGQPCSEVHSISADFACKPCVGFIWGAAVTGTVIDVHCVNAPANIAAAAAQYSRELILLPARTCTLQINCVMQPCPSACADPGYHLASSHLCSALPQAWPQQHWRPGLLLWIEGYPRALHVMC